ncbi:MAG TPA: DUF4294 domain-containing protein [Anseongella sp.]|nr:DUF4294 domain-containing protein [Anseongella sp.]
MLLRHIALVFFLFTVHRAAAQDPTQGGRAADSVRTRAVINEGDTIPNFLLPPVFVTGKLTFRNRRERIRYTKLRRDVLKVLPYAKFAGAKYREMEHELLSAQTKKEEKAIIDQIEKEIKENFEKDLRKLTITQGKILIKLIDRETGRTSYLLLQELKSRFTAFFWQSVARVFGHNLKEQYDPEEEAEIEKVIRSVEMDQYYQFYNGQYYLQVQHKQDQRTKD